MKDCNIKQYGEVYENCMENKIDNAVHGIDELIKITKGGILYPEIDKKIISLFHDF